MKRTAALVLSLILCVSLATSAFAFSSGSSYSETYYPEEIIVQTLSNGNVSATIPSSSITAGKAVVLPTTVKAADSSEAASTISLSIPKNASGVKVEIPVSNLSEGTVVVLVNADGTEKIFKASTTTEKGVSFVANSSCTVKIVNNEKTFSDLSGWEVPGVAYVSSRELLIGDNNGNFLP